MLEDELLKLRLICGSPAALEQIYNKYVDSMVTIAVGLLHDPGGAEDVVHDTFLRLAQSNRGFRL